MAVRLWVDFERCIGCLACSSSCRQDVIRVEDAEGLRRVAFPARCDQKDCEECVGVCPEEALSLVEVEETEREETVLTFELSRSMGCGTEFTTGRLLDKVRRELPEELAREPELLDWIHLCTQCRRRRQRSDFVTSLRRRG